MKKQRRSVAAAELVRFSILARWLSVRRSCSRRVSSFRSVDRLPFRCPARLRGRQAVPAGSGWSVLRLDARAMEADDGSLRRAAVFVRF